MAAVELATGYVSLAVETSDVAKQVGRMFSGVEGKASKAGQSMGKAMAKSFDQSSPDVDALAADVERAQKRIEAQAEVSARKQEAAARKVEIAQAKVAETTERYGKESSQALTAVDRLATAQQKLEAETMGAADAQRKLEKELDGAKSALKEAEGQSKKSAEGYAKGWKGIGQRLSRHLKGGVEDATDDAEKAAQKGGKEAGGRFSAGFKGAIAGMAAYVGFREIFQGIGKAVTGAGELEQSVGAIDSVFKGSAGQMHAWSDQAATSVGLSKNEFNELGTLIGAQLKNGGTAMDELAPKTEQLIGLGADLSSMFGGTTADAVGALSSALKGERDPIERYGVSLNQAKIDAEAASLGFEKVGSSLSAEANQAATLSLIMKQTADAHGNFAAESDTFAHKQQVAAAQWSDLSARIGELFLPAMTAAMGFIGSKALPALDEFVGGIRAFRESWKYADGDVTSSGFPGFMERLANTLLPVRDGFVTAFEKLKDFGAAMWNAREGIGIAVTAITALLIPAMARSAARAALTAAAHTIAWVTKRKEATKTAIQYQVTSYQMIGHMVAASAAMGIAAAAHSFAWGKMSGAATWHALKIAAAWVIALGPIAWIGAAIAAVLAGIVAVVVMNWDRIVEFTRPIWEAVAGFVVAAWDAIVDAVGSGVDWVVDIARGTWAAAVDIFGAVWEGVAGFLRTVWETSIKPLFDGIVAAWQFVAGVLNAVWLSTLKPVFDAIGAVLGWLWQHIIKPFFYNMSQFAILAFDIIVYAWNNFLAPMLAAFGAVLWALWKDRVEKVFSFIGTAWGGLVNGIRDLWNGVLAPTFKTVGDFLAAVWHNVIKGVFAWIAAGWLNLVAGAKLVWESILKPVFQAVGTVLKWVWQSMISPVFGWIGAGWDLLVRGVKVIWQNVLKPLFEAVGTVLQGVWTRFIKPVFDRIGEAWGGMVNGIKAFWENTLKPVLKAFGDFVYKTVVKRVEDAVKMIGDAWSNMGELFRNPINWVLENVWNNGIVKIFNDVAGAVGSDAKLIPADLIPKGFATGGYTGDGGKYQPAGIVHAGEYVIRKEATAKLAKTVGFGGLDQMNRTGQMPGFFGGGYVKPVSGPLTSGYGAPRGKYPHAGVDYAVPIGTTVRAILDGIVERVGTNIVPGRTGKGMLVGHNGGKKSYFGHLSAFLAGVGQKVTAGQAIAKSGNTGKSTGPHLHFETWLNGKAVNPLTGKGGFDTGDGGGGGFDLLAGLQNLVGGALGGLRDAFPAGGRFVDVLFDSGKFMINQAVDWAGRKLAEMGDFFSPTAGGIFDINKGTKDQVKSVANGYGWGKGEQWNALHEIINRESSWRLNAANPNSSARGLFQKMTSVHGPIEATAGDQAGWGLHYIKSRYGNPLNALAHHNRKGWYAGGGLVKPFLHDNGGWHMPGTFSYNGLREPEAVLTPDEARAFKRLAESAASSQSPATQVRGVEPSVVINGNVGYDPQEIIERQRIERKRQLLAAGIS